MTARFPTEAAARRAHRVAGDAATRRTIRSAKPPFEIARWPRLAVVAPSLTDAVRLMGGWLFDQAMVGSDAAILTAEHGDGRAALILGARARTLEAVLAAPLPWARFQSLTVHAGLYQRDPRVRQAVHDARQLGPAEVMFCGGKLPGEFERAATPVRYQLSIAARAFKAHALAALPVSAGTEAPWPAAPDPAVEVFSRVSA